MSNEIEDKLLASFLEYSKALIEAMQKKPPNDAPSDRDRVRIILGESVISFEERKARKFNLPVQTAIDEQRAAGYAQELERCAKLHFDLEVMPPLKMSDGDGNAIENPTFEQARSWLIIKLGFPVAAALDSSGVVEFEEEALTKNYLDYRESWAGEVITEDIIIPIHNVTFESLEFPICIDDRLTLKKVDDDMAFEYWDSLVRWSRFHDLHSLGDAKIALCGEVNDLTKELPEIKSSAGGFITALRLLADGSVGAAGCMHLPRYIGFMGGGGGIIDESISEPWGGRKLVITDSLISAAKGLCRKIKILQEKGSLSSLETAVRRYNMSYQRKHFEDKVIDLTISLESSVLHGVKDELNYRLAVRCSSLLAKKIKPETTFSFAKCLYSLRSIIVHQGIIQKDVQSAPGSVKKVFKNFEDGGGMDMAVRIVRESVLELIYLVEEKGSLDAALNFLDEDIISKIG
ncbi:HEPN domain-containing protein [Microbulbifer aggregans]|uniref:HEPN domain-containing protein n=1 Tax=Microbulbifer aggregans TaxID=1769779 RepID=UPI001CFD0F34|nr:HEPN domain-containing protein [Microbulbifer aggregans]